MQFSLATILALSAAPLLASAGGVAFMEDDQSASCGGGESVMICTEPACVMEVSDIAGCTGNTDAFTGACSENSILPAGSAGATVTEGVCGSATVIMNRCHENSPMCIDFHNDAGDLYRITCPGGTRTDVPCDDAVQGTCHDIGLGDC